MSSNRLKLFLSGGKENYSPNLSLGGLRSKIEIGTGKNNLFDDVPLVDARAGKIDFRCLFIKNTSESTANNCRVKISKESDGEDEIFLSLQTEFPIAIDVLEGEADLPVGEGISQEILNLEKGIPKIDLVRGNDKGTPTDRLKIQIFDDQMEELFVHEIPATDWASMNPGERFSIFPEITTRSIKLNLTRTGEIDPNNDYQVKYSPIFHYFDGALKIFKDGIWQNRLGNLCFRTYKYSETGFEIEDWGKEFYFNLIPNQSIPLWFKRVVPAGCKPIDFNLFRIQLRGEFDE